MDAEGFLIAALSAACLIILALDALTRPAPLPPITLFGG